MTCPGPGEWYHKNNKIEGTANNKTYHIEEYGNDKKGLYYCRYSETNYYFYVQGNGK